MDKSKQKGTFTGSVDQLLEHCSTLDVDQLHAACEKRDSLDFIMKEANCSVEEAEQIYKEIALREVEAVIEDLVRDGLLEIAGYDENGDPTYAQTELGKKVSKEITKKKK